MERAKAIVVLMMTVAMWAVCAAWVSAVGPDDPVSAMYTLEKEGLC